MMNREAESYHREGLPFFVATVENTADPLQIGRVQIRAIGYHPEKADGAVPTEHLPWAYVALPTTASGVSGIGSTHGLVDGSWVVGYFLDGRDAQQPLVVGSLVGAPGFSRSQADAVRAGQSLPSVGPGPLGGAFQTGLSRVIGGLGPATKFGATVGSALSLVDAVRNSDFLGLIGQVTTLFNPSGPRVAPDGLTALMDKATSDRASAAAGASYATSVNGSVDSVLSAGGASGFSQYSQSPLSSASFGSVGRQGETPNGDTSTVSVSINYDSLAEKFGDSVGTVVVGSTDTPKTSRYTAASLVEDEKNKPLGKTDYDLVIDQSGQVVKIGDSAPKTVTSGSSSSSSVRIALIGGAGDGGVDSKYWPVQLQVLERVVGAFVKKNPSVVVAGQNEVESTSSPGFNVSEWASAKFPKNVNTTLGGDKKVTGSSSSTFGAVAIPPPGLSSETGVPDFGGVRRTVSSNPRGFQGGLSHPVPSYASIRDSDVPAMARTNSLTGGRGSAGSSAASGGPAQQYLAQTEEPSQWTYHKARLADTLEARSVPNTWNVPTYKHGGEYNRTHVVRSTEGGHHVVLDDTPGRQKVEVMHSSGSSVTIQADGSGVFYMKKDGYEVVLGDKKVGINGSFDLSVGGDMRVSVKGDLAYDVTGKITFNGASSMHELIRGDRHTVTEGSHLFQSKKNAVHRVGKDLDISSGGKTSVHTRGVRHDVVDGNRTQTTRGESEEFNGGNKTSLTLGSSVSHANHVVNQSVGEMVNVAKGNMVSSSKGNMTVVCSGVGLFEAKGDSKIISGGKTSITAGGAVDVNAGGAVNVDGSTINLNSGASSAATGTSPADVDSPPAQLTRESNVADSSGNLDSEQTTMGGMDKMEATDERSSGGTTPGSIGSSGGGGSGDSAFTPVQAGQPISAGSLGNQKGSACGIANDLVGRGWSQEGASAIVGNMINESALNPGAIVTDVNGLPSGGLIQWNGPRFSALQRYSAANGMDYRTQAAQLAFLDYEARNDMSGGGGMGLINGGTLDDAIRNAAEYEKFVGWNNGAFTGGAWENANGNRAGNALAVYNECFGNDLQTVGGQAPGTISAYAGGDPSGASGSSDYGTGTGTDGTPATGVKGPYVSGGSVDWGMKVSPNYTLGQMCPTSKFHEGMNPSGSGSISSQQLITNLSGVAVNVMEVLLAKFGRANVMSGYRSLSYNRSVGGAANSDHMKGQAVDIIVPGRSAAEVANWVEKNIPTIAGIGRYTNHSPPFTHVSFYLGGNGGRIRRWGR